MRATMTMPAGSSRCWLCHTTSAIALGMTLARSGSIGRRAASFFSCSDTQTMRVVQAASRASASQALSRISAGAWGLKPKPCTV